jgi:hypothetical protein
MLPSSMFVNIHVENPRWRNCNRLHSQQSCAQFCEPQIAQNDTVLKASDIICEPSHSMVLTEGLSFASDRSKFTHLGTALGSGGALDLPSLRAVNVVGWDPVGVVGRGGGNSGTLNRDFSLLGCAGGLL